MRGIGNENFNEPSKTKNSMAWSSYASSLYSISIERRPLHPLLPGRYCNGFEPQGCLTPFSTIILRARFSVDLLQICNRPLELSLLFIQNISPFLIG